MKTRWDQFYLEDARIPNAPCSKTVQMASEIFRNRNICRILDIGCGIGRDSDYLARKGFEVIGSDLSLNGIRLGVKCNRNEFVNFIVSDALSQPFRNEAFDGVYCFGLIHEFIEESDRLVTAIMQEIWRLLRCNGLFALSILAGRRQDGLPHVLLYDMETFRKITSCFKTVQISEISDIGCTGRENYKVITGFFEK